MNKTENRQAVCAANCPLNRVVTVHEIGYERHSVYIEESIDLIKTTPHLVKDGDLRERHFALHSFKEIGSFALPVFKFKKVKKQGFRGWLGEVELHWEKMEDVVGGWIRLDNGETIYVSETYEELKSLIEGVKKE